MSALDYFKAIVPLDRDAAIDYLFSHPVLLNPRWWPDFDAWLEHESPDVQSSGGRVRHVIESIRESLSDDNSKFPLGFGPVDRVFYRFQQGEITFELAMSKAQDLGAVISPLYVEIISSAAHGMSKSDWRLAVKLQQLVMEALDYRDPDDDQDDMFLTAARRWMYIVYLAVGDVPDGRIYRHAVAAGKRAVEILSERGQTEELASLLQDLGALQMDTYTHGRSSVKYMSQYNLWQQRLVDELGDEYRKYDEKELRMPPPEEAFPAAASCMRQSADLRSGTDRGASLKGLVEALTWCDIVGLEIDKKELIEAGKEAIGYFDEVDYPREHAALSNLLLRAGENVGGHYADLIAQDPDDIVKRFGREQALDLYAQIINSQLKEDPQTALQAARNRRDLVLADENDSLRRQQNTLELRALVAAMSPRYLLDVPDQDLASLANEIVEQSQSDGWSDAELAAALIGVAVYGPNLDQEADALPILKYAVELSPDLASEYRDVLQDLQANLFVGMAVNELNADNVDGAIENYLYALENFLNTGNQSLGKNMLAKVEDLADKANSDGVQWIVVRLAEWGLKIEHDYGLRGTNLLQRIYRTCMTRLGHIQKINPVLLMFLWHIAKGYRFASAIYERPTFAWRNESSEELLQRIARTEAEIEADASEETREVLLDDELILSAYLGGNKPAAGDTPQEVLENLEQRFDEQLNRSIERPGEAAVEILLTIEQIQEFLDERTVLLTYLMAPAPNGAEGIYVLLITKEDLDFRVGVSSSMPSMQIFMDDGETEIQLSPWGPLMSDLRTDLIDEDPGQECATQKALDSLAGFDGLLGGGIKEKLIELRETGKDHICFNPHGPLHFFPFQLLQYEDGTLAEDWIVTYLPNLSLLRTSRVSAKKGLTKATMSSVGLDFGENNPHRLPVIDNCEREATAVSKLYGVKAVVDRKATESNLIDALKRSELVHIATHGLQTIHAPAFHRMYLSPDAKSDGVLNAYELVGLDLDNLEVVTLSACETGLSRFDLGDNPRGLPANLLLAGAKTIVGTLWEVDTDAAELFFVSFYSKLREGLDKLDSFRFAQQTTREQYPSYRDWGAFNFIGNW